MRHAYGTLIARPSARAAFTPLPLSFPDARVAELRAVEEHVRQEADAALRHEADLLGSGPTALGDEIDWQRDFKSGYRWPPAFFSEVEVTRLGDSSDAKVPWELSRCHQFLALARAERIDGGGLYGAELARLWDAWLVANPAGFGINWANPMEVAIRAVNWTWAMSTCPPEGEELRARIAASLAAHGRHIAWTLEGTPRLRSNHYLADILGLLALGATLEGAEARRWLRRARRAFEREIQSQVLPDGAGFEASLGYHGLALEMFLLARVLARGAARPLSPAYDERLERMLAVSRAVRHDSGRVPAFGDSDSGRILPLTKERSPSPDHLLWLGAAELGSEPPPAGDPGEVAWVLGTHALHRLAARVASAPRAAAFEAAFPAGGIYVMHGGGAHLVARCGDVGQNGNGGHAHNDALSYELSYDAPLVVDSGTYTYTADLSARNAFRSTAAHSTIVVDGQEINPIAESEPFRLPGRARVRAEAWEVSADRVRLVAAHDGYRDAAGAICRRELVLNRADGAVEVRDEVDSDRAPSAESLVHLAPGVEVRQENGRAFRLASETAEVELRFDTGYETVAVERSWVSERYGQRTEAPLLRARLAADGLTGRYAFRRLEVPR